MNIATFNKEILLIQESLASSNKPITVAINKQSVIISETNCTRNRVKISTVDKNDKTLAMVKDAFWQVHCTLESRYERELKAALCGNMNLRVKSLYEDELCILLEVNISLPRAMRRYTANNITYEHYFEKEAIDEVSKVVVRGRNIFNMFLNRYSENKKALGPYLSHLVANPNLRTLSFNKLTSGDKMLVAELNKTLCK